MRKLTIMIMLMAVLSFAVYGVDVPQEFDTTTVQKIDQEHKNTRKFFSDELTRQRTEFFKQVDDRANYYEETVHSILSTAVWKLGILWFSIMFFLIGLEGILRNRLEKKKYKKLKDSLKVELRNEIVGGVQNISETKQKQPQPQQPPATTPTHSTETPFL